MRRHRAHKAGNHRLCTPVRCAAAGEIRTADVRQLASAVEAEFVGDLVRLASARRLVQLAGGTGQAAVTAIKALVDLVEVRRGRPFKPTDVLDAEVKALAQEVVELAERQAYERFKREAGEAQMGGQPRW